MILTFALIETKRPQSFDYLVIDVPRHSHEILFVTFVSACGASGAKIVIPKLSRFRDTAHTF
jgi:hypothetical protein